jgi:uncharacterized protein (DUF433 family)
MVEMRKTGMFYKDIAAFFGTKTEYIQAICHGKRWRGAVPVSLLPHKGPRITPEQIDAVVRLRKEGYCAKEIAAYFSVPTDNIFAILRRQGLGRKAFGRARKLRPPSLGCKPCQELPQTVQSSN